MRVKLCEIVTKVEYLNEKWLNNGLSQGAIKDYAYIIHHSDRREDGSLKDAHYHICLRLNNSYDTKYVAKWFNVGEQFVSRVKGRWSDVLKYLTHANAPEKYQYSDGDVVSNFNWKEEATKVDYNTRKEEIINKIATGEIKEYNYHEYITAIENDKFSDSIKKAFKYRLDLIKGVERDMECVFITGDSGVGKTTYSKEVAKNKGYSVFVSSGSNDILDGYGGQDCIILDDLRPSCMGLSDLLKMLDNHTASSVKSRYKNKVLECKMIIITTTLSIDEFFRNVFSEEEETVIQLKRRCRIHIRMECDYLYMSLWQPKSRCYSKEFKQRNPVADMYKVKDLTSEEQFNVLSEVLGFAKEYVDYCKDNVDKFDEEYVQLELVDNYESPFAK